MKSHCASCKVCQYAQKKPETFIGRIWRWHSKWCPMWKAYQKELAEGEKTDAEHA
ncbi:hypothetical protein ACFL1X_00570 [Candidatus Hydrogenedentota bacterium]